MLTFQAILIGVGILGHLSPSGSTPFKETKSQGDCGRVYQVDARVGKVLYGEDALPEEFPWMVSIKASTGEHVCGAFVISKKHIISAAHCFKKAHNKYLDYLADGNVVPGSVIVSLGQNDLTSLDKAQNATIEYIALHPDFEVGGVLNNDIAVLRTQEEMNWGTNVHPICLPETNESEYSSKNVTVAGWGNTNCPSGKLSKTLKKVSVPVWKNQACLQAYRDAKYEFTREGSEGYVCAGEHDKDASKGDSGSPLMMLQGNTWTAIGIVSAGRFMCEDRVPGVYTKISSYLTWINSQIAL